MQTRQFRLRDEFIELNRLLKVVGLCSSGGEAKAWIAAGEVLVDGARELRKSCQIRPGQRVRAREVEIEVLAAIASAE